MLEQQLLDTQKRLEASRHSVKLQVRRRQKAIDKAALLEKRCSESEAESQRLRQQQADALTAAETAKERQQSLESQNADYEHRLSQIFNTARLQQ